MAEDGVVAAVKQEATDMLLEKTEAGREQADAGE
jgi:hypothetical protein